MPRPVSRPSLSWMILALLLLAGAMPAIAAKTAKLDKKAEAAKTSGLSDPKEIGGL
jgi:hypothetical protein